MWVHGDCHLDNILLKEEMLTGIVDWGDMHKGDPALDIFVVFFLTKKDEEAEKKSNAAQTADAWRREPPEPFAPNCAKRLARDLSAYAVFTLS